MWKPLLRAEGDFGQKLFEQMHEVQVLDMFDAFKLTEQIVLWVKTVRETHPIMFHAGGYGPTWLPSSSDLWKSALFERIRHGVAPLPEPPPIGYSCPWYAVVEDPGPHSAMAFEKPQREGTLIVVHQNPYSILEARGPNDFVAKDGGHDTSYRFRIWYDPEYDNRHINVREGYPRPEKGGWLIRNMAFE